MYLNKTCDTDTKVEVQGRTHVCWDRKPCFLNILATIGTVELNGFDIMGENAFAVRALLGKATLVKRHTYFEKE